MHHYTECGLPDIYLVNGYIERDTPYGTTIAFKNLNGLHEAIGRNLVGMKKKLTGPEFRFIRHELDLSQNAIANLFGANEQSVARWENEKTTLDAKADRLIRILYLEKLDGSSEIAKNLKAIADLDEKLDGETEAFEFEITEHVWHIAA